MATNSTNIPIQQPDINLWQAREILTEIATDAGIVEALLNTLSCELATNHDAHHQLCALASLTNKIGWMADLGTEKLTGSPMVRGGAEDWFMPPSYFGKGEAA